MRQATPLPLQAARSPSRVATSSPPEARRPRATSGQDSPTTSPPSPTISARGRDTAVKIPLPSMVQMKRRRPSRRRCSRRLASGCRRPLGPAFTRPVSSASFPPTEIIRQAMAPISGMPSSPARSRSRRTPSRGAPPDASRRRRPATSSPGRTRPSGSATASRNEAAPGEEPRTREIAPSQTSQAAPAPKYPARAGSRARAATCDSISSCTPATRLPKHSVKANDTFQSHSPLAGEPFTFHQR